MIGDQNGIVGAMDSLPIAKAVEISRVDNGEIVKDMRLIVADGKNVKVLSDHYKIVQHKEALLPIVEGLGDRKYMFSMWHTHKRAVVDLMTAKAEGIYFGFRVMNSCDGTSALRYDLFSKGETSEKRQESEKVVTIWGWRETCSNGQKIMIPLAWREVVREVEYQQIHRLLAEHKRILHNKKAEKELTGIGYLVEAMVLLEKPLGRIIKLAQKEKIEALEFAEKLIEKYIGKRYVKKVMEQWENEEQSAWGLYQCVTNVGSHGYKDTTKNTIISNAAILLDGLLRNRETVEKEIALMAVAK